MEGSGLASWPSADQTLPVNPRPTNTAIAINVSILFIRSPFFTFSALLLLPGMVRTDAVPVKKYPHRVDTGSQPLFSRVSDSLSPVHSSAADPWSRGRRRHRRRLHR